MKGNLTMKKIGILGGMSAASSQLYYQTLCALTQAQLGGLHSPNLLLRSLDFAPIADRMNRGDWAGIADVLNGEARQLQQAGAELIVLATNTMHKLADEMMAGVNLPLVHIADATADAILSTPCRRPAFFATRFTMEERFYLDIMEARGIQALIPDTDQRQTINQIIFEELCRNEVRPQSEAAYLEIVETLKDLGADSVILGCTEVCLLLNAENTGLPVFDTTRIHCEAALKAALSG